MKKSSQKILFIAEKSILDVNSGAALELMAWFRILTKAGHKCASFSFSCFDGKEEYPVGQLVSRQIDLKRDHGRLAELTVDHIHHTLLLTKSTNTEKLTDADLMAFNMNAKKILDATRPDFVVYFGSVYMAPIIRHARANGAEALFYLASANYGEKDLVTLQAASEIVVPSETLRAFYKDKLGLNCQVMPVVSNHALERSADELPALAKARKERFVTMINPELLKGGLTFINIANRYQKIDPAQTFLVVESRGKRQDWIEAGIEATAIRNLWWIPFQTDISHVFRKTSVLIAPSIIYETAGKVIAEAMLCGIPVIASDRGGIKEQMKGAGQLVPLPQSVIDTPTQLPGDYVDTWVNCLRNVLDNEESYLAASQASLKAGRVYSRERTTHNILKLFAK